MRIFLMAAGGLAAPSLALAAFFLSNSGDSGAPAAKAGVAQNGRVTTTTARPGGTPTISAPTTTTTTPAPVPLSPARDPFAPLVSQAPAGGG